MIHMESVTEFISLPVVTVSYGSTPSSQPPLLLKPRRDVDHGVPASSSPESTPMSRNESSFILAKNEGNTPNIPSQINVNGAPRGTPESTRSPDTSSPISALDLPQRPAPAHIYRYPPARCVSHTSGNRTVEGPFYNEEARARGSNSVGASYFHNPSSNYIPTPGNATSTRNSQCRSVPCCSP